MAIDQTQKAEAIDYLLRQISIEALGQVNVHERVSDPDNSDRLSRVKALKRSIITSLLKILLASACGD